MTRARVAGRTRHTAFLVCLSVLFLALAGCGGGRTGHRHHHHHHGDHHGAASGSGSPFGSRDTTSIAASSGPPPWLPPVHPGRPGLLTVPVSLPALTVQLTAPSSPSSTAASKAFSARIAHAPAGAVIHLASGTYPAVFETARRHSPVTVSGEGDATKPVISEATLAGASDIRFVDVKLSAFKVGPNRGAQGAARHARDISLINSEIDCGVTTTTHGAHAITLRGAARRITFSGDYVHNCTVGFSSAAGGPFSTQVVITHSLFTKIYGDAIDLGGINGLEIANDVIEDIHRSAGHHHYHDDGIQFFGNVANAIIAYNVEANSTDQLIFIQDAIASRYTHSSVNHNVLVLGNLIYGAGAIAIQDQGGIDVQFVGNTVWANHDGSLLVRRSPFTHLTPTHTLVADNIIEGFGLRHTPSITQGYNVLSYRTPKTAASTNIVTATPGFADVLAGRFNLTAHSRAVGSAAPTTRLVAMARRAGANSRTIRILRDYSSRNRGSPITDPSWPSYGGPKRLVERAASGP